MGSALTDVQNETSDNLLPLRRMCDLRMELDTIEWLRVMGEGSIRCRLCVTDNMKILWRF